MTHAAHRTLAEQGVPTRAEAVQPETRQIIAPLLPERPSPRSLSALKADAGRQRLETGAGAVAKLSPFQGLMLPYALLPPLSPRYLPRLKRRGVAATRHERRRPPDPLRSGLVAVCGAVRAPESTDALTDRLRHVVPKMGGKAAKRGAPEWLTDGKRVTGKPG
jgi:hypothetical protein